MLHLRKEAERHGHFQRTVRQQIHCPIGYDKGAWKGVHSVSFLDLIKDTASDITTRAAENKVEVKVTSGKKNLDLGLLESRVVIRQNQDGYIYFDDINGLFKITAYQWEGPVFQTVTRTTGTTSVQSRAQSRGRES